MTGWKRWLPVLLACAACAWPATAALATTSPPPLQVVLLPCGATSPGAPCRVDPSQIQVDIPTDGSVKAVQLSWVPGVDRPSSAPSPASQQVVLTVAKGTNGPAADCQHPAPAPSGTTGLCWTWPSSLLYSPGGTNWLLNGTYRVTACSDTSSSTPCAYSSRYNSALTGIAVPPAAPARVAATQSEGAVTVSWNPGPEPDLVGYAVSRDNRPVYTCSTDGAGPGAGTPCSNPPSFQDRPGPGSWSYSVTALRFGSDATASHAVASPPTPASVDVPAPATSSSGPSGHSGGPPGPAVVPTLPPVGTMRPAQLNPASGVAANAVPSLADTGDSGATATGAPATLAYRGNTGLGKTLASGTRVSRRDPPKPSVHGPAELALGVIALSLAVHAWFLRGELRMASVRLADRRASGEAAG